jgi:hypothetical protein
MGVEDNIMTNVPAQPLSDFKSCFSFTFVRNPFARLVSSYFHFKRLAERPIDKAGNFVIKVWEVSGNRVNLTFSEFVQAISKIKDHLANPHFLSQHCSMPDNIDFIGRVENIDTDWKFLQEKYGFPALQRLQTTQHQPYHTYYSERAVRLIRGRYKRDFELFSYSATLAGS